MICPQCHAEYRTEITRCADCDVDLQEQLVSTDPAQSHEPVEILSTQDLSLIPVLRSILGGADIPYEVRGDQNFSLQPAFDILTGRERTPIVILVPGNRADEARSLVELPESSASEEP